MRNVAAAVLSSAFTVVALPATPPSLSIGLERSPGRCPGSPGLGLAPAMVFKPQFVLNFYILADVLEEIASFHIP